MRMSPRKLFHLKLRSRVLRLGARTLIMGVLNVTPDSFSDGNRFPSVKTAVEAAFAIERAGADILDIGAESTRPGSAGISASQELARLLPVLEALRGRLKIPISVDTRKAGVAELAIEPARKLSTMFPACSTILTSRWLLSGITCLSSSCTCVELRKPCKPSHSPKMFCATS